jgi:hypothetical protein
LETSSSLEVCDPLSLVEIGWVVNLHLFVDWGNFSLDWVLVLSVDESKLALGAVVRGVHDEDKFGLVTAVGGFVLEVVNSVSGLIGGHGILELSEGGSAGACLFDLGASAVLTDGNYEESVSALHAEVAEMLGDVVGDLERLHVF